MVRAPALNRRPHGRSGDVLWVGLIGLRILAARAALATSVAHATLGLTLHLVEAAGCRVFCLLRILLATGHLVRELVNRLIYLVLRLLARLAIRVLSGLPWLHAALLLLAVGVHAALLRAALLAIGVHTSFLAVGILTALLLAVGILPALLCGCAFLAVLVLPTLLLDTLVLAIGIGRVLRILAALLLVVLVRHATVPF